MTVDFDDIERRMDGAITSFKKDMAGIRTGRASASFLDPVTVDAYGQIMPLNQLGTVNVPEARMICVQVWDKEMVKPVEKAIANAGLGVNPSADGNLIRVPIPELSQERRAELAKLASKYAENARIAIRNVRRDGMEQLKKAEKSSEISEDEMHGDSDKIQKETDKHVAEIDRLLEAKEKEIMQV